MSEGRRRLRPVLDPTLQGTAGTAARRRGASLAHDVNDAAAPGASLEEARPVARTRSGQGWRRGALALVLIGLAILSFGVGWGDRSLYPAAAGDAVPVLYVSNGFHAGLLVPVPDVRAAADGAGLGAVAAVGARFEAYDWIELGWGDEGFYREVPTVADLNWRLGLRALAGLGTGSVLHVVGIAGDPRRIYGQGNLVALSLSRAGFGRLLGRLDASFARGPGAAPIELGQGLYGPSLFYRAEGRFFFGNVCNHWIARLLDAAGVPVSPLLATIPRGLAWDLAWRSGLTRERAPALSEAPATQ